MELPVVQLPSTNGARLTLTAKSFSNIAHQAEEQAALLRAEAKAGTVHPRTAIEFHARSLADLEALRKATKAEIAVADDAVRALEGRPVPANSHPLILTCRQMAFAAAAFTHSGSTLARDKSLTLIDDAKLQVRAMRDYAARQLGENEHRLDATRRKLAQAFRTAISMYSGDFGFTLKDAAALLQLPGIPADDDTMLPAPDFNERLPGDDPARKAAVLQRVCSSAEAADEMIEQHKQAAVAAANKRKTRAERALEELNQLEAR